MYYCVNEPSGIVPMSQPEPPVVFFGYPRIPVAQREAVVAAADRLHATGALSKVLWESLSVAGRFVIDAILEAIDTAGLAAFDVTTLNHNVMFELGYAIGTGQKIWLFRDESDIEAKRKWDRVKILTTVGYSAFTNSEHLVNAFWEDRPDETSHTIFQTAIADHLQSAGAPALFYMPSLHETEAGRKLTRRVRRDEERGIRCVVADPEESSVQSLSWHAQNVYSSAAVVAHFCSPNRYGADVHNARCALVAALARGMEKPLLMLAEDDYTTPIDYRDLVHVYTTAADCRDTADRWLAEKLAPTYERLRTRPQPSAGTQLAVELRSLRLGEHVAENEAADLAEYFIETASFQEVLEKNTTVFVGRKGTGKTANMIQAAATLRADKRNLVCVIKPMSYELDGIVELMRRYQESPDQGYVVESLWKFLIYSEVAKTAYNEIVGKPALPASDSDEYRFLSFMEGPGAFLKEDFTARLETAVDGLRKVEPGPGLADQRTRISEALHRGILLQLRGHLGKILSRKVRVAVLMDNLDKTWQRRADIDKMAVFLLGLLSSVGRVSDEFRASDRWREPVVVTLAVFIRSDIYEHVARIAREPDKIPVSRLFWADNDLLLRIIEERYAVYQGPQSDGKEIWIRFFCPLTRGMKTPDYILSRILPKPRDLIYVCSEAIASAVNRRHATVEQDDILTAEQHYSQFALESLRVENGISIEELEAVLYEFAGGPAEVSGDDVATYITRSGMASGRAPEVIERLRSLSFLGVEIGDNRFDFATEARAPEVANALAQRHAMACGRPVRYQVHPAFRSYLEIRE